MGLGVKIFALTFFGALAYLLFFTDPGDMDSNQVLLYQLGVLSILALILWSVVNHKKGLIKYDARNAETLDEGHSCINCGSTEFNKGDKVSCLKCNITVYGVNT
jgi:uncharacterized paraquat-inducible protein A